MQSAAISIPAAFVLLIASSFHVPQIEFQHFYLFDLKLEIFFILNSLLLVVAVVAAAVQFTAGRRVEFKSSTS